MSPRNRQLEFEDVWAMFGEGRHPDIARLFEHRLAPFMTQTSVQFWRKRLHYFRTGLYYQGGMVRHHPCPGRALNIAFAERAMVG